MSKMMCRATAPHNGVVCHPGRYFLGDPCYVIGDKWDEACDAFIQGNVVGEGCFELADGTEFAIYSTKYGDGVYTDDCFGHEFPVDSGSIGLVPEQYIDKSKIEAEYSKIFPDRMGSWIEFDQEFTAYALNGVMRFGNIIIDTHEAAPFNWSNLVSNCILQLTRDAS